jgi:hypothetical protein
MLTPDSPIIIAGLFSLFLAILAIISLFFMPGPKKWVRPALLSVTPALLMLALFYSLVLHMWFARGAWPTTVGEVGLPWTLVYHARFTSACFGLMVLLNIYLWPVIFLACFFVRRWFLALWYLSIYALAFLVCFGLIQLAPPLFLRWWWD